MLLNIYGSLSAKNYHAKGNELLNSKDPFAVAVMTGELIVDRQKILQFAGSFCGKNGSILCWVTGPVAQWQCAQLPQLIVSKRLWDEENFLLYCTSFSPTFLPTIFALRQQSLDNTSVCVQVYPWIITWCFSYCITRIEKAFSYFHILIAQLI